MRKFIVEGVILKTRPKKTQANYKRIWEEGGSPLIFHTERLRDKIQANTDIPIIIAMRYAEPSLQHGLQELANKGVNDTLVIPLFPQYAMATIESATVKIGDLVKKHFSGMDISILPPFYNNPDYIEVMARNIKEQIADIKYDHLLFSYHGIPERHIRKSDITHGHCKMNGECCQTPSPAHQFCYRHQCLETTRLIAKQLGLPEETYGNSFQSRLGPIPWLKPYTDKRMKELAKKGAKKLAIASPAFVADCIETIDELGREGKEEFEENGGEEFHLISCLNDRQDWADLLLKWVEEWSGKNI